MTDREKILARIREALTVPAPRPHEHGPAPVAHVSGTAREWLPAAGDTPDEQLSVFRANAIALKASLVEVRSVEEMTGQLCALRDAEGWTKVGSHSGTLTTPACEALGVPVCYTHDGYAAEELEACDVGITECDALIAQTGSVLVTARSAGGRALSVLPPHHVVLARRDQLLRDLPAAFDLLKSRYASNYPSMISFITGPSRTGDIERILVLGAHGPKNLTIILCSESLQNREPQAI